MSGLFPLPGASSLSAGRRRRDRLQGQVARHKFALFEGGMIEGIAGRTEHSVAITGSTSTSTCAIGGAAIGRTITGRTAIRRAITGRALTPLTVGRTTPRALPPITWAAAPARAPGTPGAARPTLADFATDGADEFPDDLAFGVGLDDAATFTITDQQPTAGKDMGA